MPQRVFKATFIIDGDDLDSLRIEDLRSNLENLLGHAPYSTTLELEEDTGVEKCQMFECKNFQLPDCAKCPHGY
jgi:hypothetical protein